MNSVEIEFENLTYVHDNKRILNGINGRFPSRKLTGILGCSGAGKSTLLNALAGLVTNGVSGNIFVNGKPRNNKTFQKISSYITQDDVIQHHLTVTECIFIAANLKLGKIFSEVQKQEIINLILKSMCLEQCIEVKTQYLSGGQRKRLIVALELINNPPVIFLDEPTTGLDEVTTLSCMKLFKKLTSEGRTIICTIHQPSDNVFGLFDHVYFLSNGICVYQGNTQDIIHFFNDLNLSCPVTYNPADYIIELVDGNSEMAGLFEKQAKIWNNGIQEDLRLERMNDLVPCESDLAPFCSQVSILVRRRLKQIFRNKLHLSIEIGHNIFSGISIGLLFYKMGNNASFLINNLFIFYALNIYLMFTYGITMVLLYPFEINIIQREYMNRWYNLKSYFLALTISSLPIAIIGSIILSMIIFYMTGQPSDQIYRIFYFTFATILFALTSQGFGLAIGTLFQPINGACIGSAIGISLLLISMHGIGYGMQVSQVMKVIMSLSFAYHAYTAYLVSIFGFRSSADCQEVFCYFSNPKDILNMMGMDEGDYLPSILYLCVFLVLHRMIAYAFLRERLNPDTKLYKMLQ